MDLVQPWLVVTIGRELDKTLEWRDDPENLHLLEGVVYGSGFEDDGSNLRIRPLKVGQTLQIIKFIDCSEPVKAILSDSITRINVSFATAASRQHEKKTRQRLSQGSLGGVVQLLDFQLVATPYGPRPSRLTLFIKDFKILGSAGSGVKGVPRPIEDAGEMSVFLEKLAKQRRGQDQSESRGPSTCQSSPKTSSTQSPVLKDGFHEDTQPEPLATSFATQIPRFQAPKKSSEVCVENGDDTLATQPSPSDPNTHCGERVKPLALHKVSNADLLNLLGPKPQIKRAGQSSMAPKDTLTERSQDAVDHEAETDLEERNTNAAFGELDPSRLQDTSAVPQKSGSNLAPEEVSEEENLRSTPTPVSGTASGPPRPPLSPGPSTAAKDGPIVRSALAPPKASSKAPNDVSKMRDRRHRISKRDIRIAKEQDKLLNRSDSWVPAEPGQREPVANVPIAILKALNEEADQRAERSQKQISNSPSRIIHYPTPKENAESDLDSDAPLSWSSSSILQLSDCERLPPDSSPTLSTQVASRAPTHGAEGTPRKPLQSSINSCSGGSMNVKPTPGIPTASSNEEETGLVLDLSDSDPLANNIGVQHYQCRTCNKLYSDERRLRQHLSLFHPCQDPSIDLGRPESLRGDLHSYPPSEAEKPAASPSTTARPKLNEAANEFQKHGADKLANEVPIDRIEQPRENLVTQCNTAINPDCEALSNTSKHRNSNESTSASSKGPTSPTPLASLDSELEITMPRALSAAEPLQAFESSVRDYSFTASQPQMPFTQVKTTPYVNGHIQSGAPIASHDSTLFLDDHNASRVSGTSVDSSGFATLSRSAPPEAFDNALAVASVNSRPAHNRSEEKILDATTDKNEQKRKTSASADAPSRDIKRYRFSEYISKELTEDGERLSPSDMARHYRQEFFTSRRSSVSSPAEVNTVSLEGADPGNPTTFPGTSGREEVDVASNGPDVGDLAANPRTSFRISEPSPTKSLMDLSSDVVPTSSLPKDFNGSHTGIYLKYVGAGLRDNKEAMRSIKNLLVEPHATTVSLAYPGLSCVADENIATEKPTNASTISTHAGVNTSSLMDVNAKGAQSHRQGFAATCSPPLISRTCDLSDVETSSKGISSRPEGQRIKSQQGEITLLRGNIPSTMPGEPPTEEQAQREVEIRTDERDLLVDKDIFDIFKIKYPDYLGDKKHFKVLCSRINRLIQDDACLPQFLWDDFIVRQKTEYSKYVQQCAEEAEDPLSYEKYYLRMTDGPMYMKKVVTERTLSQALGTEKHRDSAATTSQKDGNPDMDNIERPQPRFPGSQLGLGPRQRDKRCITIDLTADDQEPVLKHRTENKPRPNTSTSSPAIHRSLPWTKQKQTGYRSSSPSGLGATERRRASRQTLTRFLDSDAAKQWQVDLDEDDSNAKAVLEPEELRVANFNRRIRSAWNIKAEDVLRPGFMYEKLKDKGDNSSMNKEQLELLADIAESIDFESGRALLRAEYLARARQTDEGALLESTDDILESVRKRLLNESVDHSRMSPELGDLGRQGSSAWWQDNDTPFKSFVRNYNAIQPGKGNSYAKPEDIERGKEMRKEGKIHLKQFLNVLNWHI